MKEVKKKVYLVAKPAAWEESGYWYDVISYEPEGGIIVDSLEVCMTVPDDFDPTQPHIDALKAEKQKIAGDAQIKMNNLEEQIQSLLAIEFKGEE